jgi:hypothetical protein
MKHVLIEVRIVSGSEDQRQYSPFMSLWPHRMASASSSLSQIVETVVDFRY